MKFNKQNFIRNLSNLPGWRTNRKIIVFESDDWGSNRMPSKEAFNSLYDRKIISEDSAFHFYKYDSIECNQDLEGLFEVLSSFKDKNGKHPVFTGVNVVANPDFEEIKANNFSEYIYEPFTKTLGRYKNHDRVLDLWKEGAANNLFVPQFHGREHLNVMAWLRSLKSGKSATMQAFDYGVFGLNSIALKESTVSYLAAFDLEHKDDLKVQSESITEGISIFKELLGYKPLFFVPSNGPFNLTLEKTLADEGITYLMLNKFQKEPLGGGKYKNRFRYLGKKNEHGQIYLTRNASFEPASPGTDWIDYTLSQLELTFKWHKPATIGTHRVNYSGFLYPENRDNGLRLLTILLKAIIARWPDVEFMTSVELGDQIRNVNS
jgi:hypothetical protein